ncbi:MAG TPA: RsmB/NOP family class I SAM-dependent RNA methyltransferase [Pyrodictium sp.]|nr:RsmB/NOP family class I SAM-dependent RNA methyltransferase [Pyrodictium sp.]
MAPLALAMMYIGGTEMVRKGRVTETKHITFNCKDIKALFEAIAEGERIKPFQVAKRTVFARYGISGTRKDRIFTAIVYKFFKVYGILDKIVIWALKQNTLDKLCEELRIALKLAAYLTQLDTIKDRRLIEAFKNCIKKHIAEKCGTEQLKLFETAFEKMITRYWKPSKEELMELKYKMPYLLIKLFSKLVKDDKEFEDLMAALNSSPPLGFRINTLKTKSVEEVVRELQSAGVRVWVSKRVPFVIRYIGGLDYSRQKLLKEGIIVPQDETSALAAILLDPQPSEVIVDLCAAPGGKTTHVAELSRNLATVIALEIYPDRMARLVELANKTSTYISIYPIITDARYASKILARIKAHKVLIDPPCTSTGALAKHPDARWRLTEEKLRELVELQRTLLEEAHKLLRVGGRLLYTTCSILVEENEDNIKWFLEKYPCYRIIPLRKPYEESPWLPGTMRAWPHKHNTTGFYYALLEKVDEC